ncbi:MAG TPA: MBL fold metallo-hydrolase, partial [Anaerolineales bacterium]|nr:MBL fold metallo-hydrolase [Anaerolineales bacterium]
GTAETVKHVLEHNQSSDTFPISLRDMASNKDIQSLRETQVIVWDEDGVRVQESSPSPSPEAVVIRIHKSYAHPGSVYHYRIEYQGKSIVYATDTEGYVGTDRKLVNFTRNADVLIHDAQYSDDHYYGCLAGFPSTQGYGHSTATMAGQVAASAETGQLILFHHDPAYADDWVAAQERAAKNIFPDSLAAFEGMTLALTPQPLSQRARGVKEVKYVTHG